ncbi:hypothetical protein J6590_104251 [Homalodisca vitripennis]|nr:hypothetical protein J6590_104251 [Homalodisca vitripennis]
MAYQELVESHVVGPVSGHRSSSAGFIPSPPPPPPDAPAEDKCHHHTERILEMGCVTRPVVGSPVLTRLTHNLSGLGLSGLTTETEHDVPMHGLMPFGEF